MAERLVRNVDHELLKKVQIHVSRPKRNCVVPNAKQVLWCHDLATDPESNVLSNDGHKKFDKIVFVSYWQRDQYVMVYNIPYSKCTVIENAIEKQFSPRGERTSSQINFIYHTTPHRGLQLVYPIFNTLCRTYNNLYLNVYSSFEIYGWKQRDKAYQNLFDQLNQHPNISYHGFQPNNKVLDALDKTDIFLYPCIWPETSCIAMIEAIKSGVLVIHPNLAALPETSAGSTLMYDYTESIPDHIFRAYLMTVDAVNNIQNFTPRGNDSRYDISTFTNKWNALLGQLTG